MIAFEIAFLTFLGVVLVVGIAAMGRPMAEAYSERLKFQYRELGSQAEAQLRKKNEILQQEVIDLRERVRSLEETAQVLSDQLNHIQLIEKREHEGKGT